MLKFQAPNVPFVEAYNKGSKHKPTAIVLTLSSTTSDKGAALGIANRLHLSNAPANSYHYMVDEAETYRGVWDRVAAYNAPYRSIDILVCAEPTMNVKEWALKPRSDVLLRTAKLVANLSLSYRIRPRILDEEAEKRWLSHKSSRRGGIILNFVGEFPHDPFLTDVDQNMEVMKWRVS